jgi:hypothetical protein
MYTCSVLVPRRLCVAAALRTRVGSRVDASTFAPGSRYSGRLSVTFLQRVTPVYHPTSPPLWNPQLLLLTEYLRMGVPNRFWRISDANAGFDLCSTYPSVLAFPVATSNDQIALACAFRSQRA